jgi:regulator of protease activity HflC (stomatin/prohibitin superfamily)
MLPINFVSVIVVLLIIYLFNAIRVIREYERAVVFRLGRVLTNVKGPGIFFIFWPVDKMVKVELRTITMEVPTQDVITKDNVSVKVNAVAYFRVIDAKKAIIEVENYVYATSQFAQTTLRSILGEVALDDLLSRREHLNLKIQEILDKHTDPWGIKVSNVEIKQVDLPDEMRRAMAKQAEAEREKRAKIIHAEGELQASQKLAEASKILSGEPVSIQLRYLQTLTEIGVEKNTTIVFPLPVNIFEHLLKKI